MNLTPAKKSTDDAETQRGWRGPQRRTEEFPCISLTSLRVSASENEFRYMLSEICSRDRNRRIRVICAIRGQSRFLNFQ